MGLFVRRVLKLSSIILILIITDTFAIAGNPNNAHYSEQNDNIFWFAQTSDIHIGRSGTQDSDNLNWITREASQVIEPSFIVPTGDLTDCTNGWPFPIPGRGPFQAEWDEYRNILNPPVVMNSDIYFDSPGNHDQYNEADPLQLYLNNSIQGVATGATQQSWIKNLLFGKYHFINIATPDPDYTNPAEDPLRAPGGLRQEEINFIRNELIENQDANLTFVFGHHPISYLEYGRDNFVSLLQEYSVSVYGFGHTHDYSVNMVDGTLYFNIASLGKSNNNQYAIFAVDNDGLSVTSANVNQWPIVLITTPIDRNLGGVNPYDYPVPVDESNPIRALVFDENPVSQVQYRIDGGDEWFPMSKVRRVGGSSSYLWETKDWDTTSLEPGIHTLEVQATGSTTTSDIITFEISLLDLIFTIDTTSSMWDDIAQVKTAATEIVNSIASSGLDYRVAVVDYRDFPVYPYGGSDDYPYNVRLPFSSDESPIISAIQGLSLGWGADWQESVYSALIRSINTEGLGDWRDGAKKIIILMGDAPPHDPEPFTGYTLSDVSTAAAAVDPASIYSICIGGDPVTYAYFSSLAEDTGGKVFTALSASDVVDAILSAIESALQSPIAEAGGPYTGTIGSPITFDASGSYDPDGVIGSYEWDFDNDGSYDKTVITPTTTYTYLAEYTGLVRLRVTDNDGLTAIDTASVELTNQAPVADAGPDQVVSAGPNCMASATLDGSGSFDADGDPLNYTWTWDSGSTTGVSPTIQLPLGTFTITLVVNDGIVDSYPDTVTITVIDTPPEITSIIASPDTLWPPNHKMVEVSVDVSAADNCDPNPVCMIISVTSNEPEDALGDGATAPDWEITDDLTVNLRAERSGQGSGRVYTITVQCTDTSNNSATASATVTVPHDQQ